MHSYHTNALSISTYYIYTQVHMTNSIVCTEVCWALRHMALLEKNRSRIVDEFGPECVISVLKPYFKVYTVV